MAPACSAMATLKSCSPTQDERQERDDLVALVDAIDLGDARRHREQIAVAEHRAPCGVPVVPEVYASSATSVGLAPLEQGLVASRAPARRASRPTALELLEADSSGSR